MQLDPAAIVMHTGGYSVRKLCGRSYGRLVDQPGLDDIFSQYDGMYSFIKSMYFYDLYSMRYTDIAIH